ncbi:MAG: DNA-directed RNA polymerase subunit delta [Metamycoplasmataceae bacterium]
MKTILSVIKEKMGNTIDEFAFDDIYQEVESQLNNQWKNQFPDLSDEQIRENKIGETYKILTIDGSFIRTPEGLWRKK